MRHPRARGAHILWLICIALPVSNTAAATPPSTSAFSSLEQWTLSRGGKVHVHACTNSQGLRGLCSSAEARAGTTLIEVPAEGLITCRDVKECTKTLYHHLHNRSSHLTPYLDLMPARGQVLSRCNMPSEVLPLLESDWLQADVLRVQSQLDSVLTDLSKQYGPGLTLEEVQYTCSVAYTRTIYDAARGVSVMMPVIDLLNHRQGCPHTVESWDRRTQTLLRPLSRPDPSDVVYVYVVQSDVKAGDELCFSYADSARDDSFLLSWGFIPHSSTTAGGHQPPQLLAVDDPQAQSKVTHWQGPGTPAPALPLELPSTQFTGSAAQVAAELQRLKQLLHHLEQHSQQGSRAAASVGQVGSPHVRSEHHWVVSLLTELQRRRREALRHEIARLTALQERSEQWWAGLWHTLAAVLKTVCSVVLCLTVVVGLALSYEALLATTM